MRSIDATHDPGLTSWVDSANPPQCDFPLQNLPFAVFRRSDSREPLRCGVGIGDAVLDLTALGAAAPRSGPAAEALGACAAPALNGLMALGPAGALALRQTLSQLLRAGSAHAAALASALVPQAQAQFAVPAQIGNGDGVLLPFATFLRRQFGLAQLAVKLLRNRKQRRRGFEAHAKISLGNRKNQRHHPVIAAVLRPVLHIRNQRLAGADRVPQHLENAPRHIRMPDNAVRRVLQFGPREPAHPFENFVAGLDQAFPVRGRKEQFVDFKCPRLVDHPVSPHSRTRRLARLRSVRRLAENGIALRCA